MFDTGHVWRNPSYGDHDARRFHQRILNAEKPAKMPTRPARRPIKVMARLVWERDGEQWMPAVASRWTKRHVLVTWDEPDPRVAASLAWLRAEDVVRR